MSREIRIIGGGLAGLTLGILLRRENVPVEIREAGTYPRHKVCGEFISGRGLEILRRLEINDVPEPLGSPARALRLSDSTGRSCAMELPEPALAIDRARLDSSLAAEFRRIGGILHENSRWTESFASEGVVRASGRRLQTTAARGLVGVKIHARNIDLGADLEMYFSDHGYVGMSRLGNGVTNICALFRDATQLRKIGARQRDGFAETFGGSMGAELRARLSEAQFLVESFAAVAGFSLKRESFLRNECCVGDSLCMIPPMTGNGMSIALETASIAAPLLREYHHGAAGWRDTVDAIARSCETTLRRRLFSAGVLQSACFSRAGRFCLLATMRAAPRLFTGCFWLTR